MDRNDETDQASARTLRAIWFGIICCIIGLVLLFSPLVWGPRFSYNKYFVVLGVILSLMGASVLLNGGIDWVRSKRRRR